MLSELRISNVAIIDELQLTFAPGMNVLTGETGAGKSIIMRAIGVLCGDRAATDLIRTDAEEAEIEGLFDLADSRHRRAAGERLAGRRRGRHAARDRAFGKGPRLRERPSGDSGRARASWARGCSTCTASTSTRCC